VAAAGVPGRQDLTIQVGSMRGHAGGRSAQRGPWPLAFPSSTAVGRCAHCSLLLVFVFAVQARWLPPKTGLSVNVMEDGMGNPEAALGKLAKKGMDSGMMRDWTFRSPLAPGTNRYEKPTQHRQRLERKGLWEFRQRSLLTILRAVLFKKVRS